jgi:hypothetical protein
MSDKAFPAAGTYCGTPYLTGNSANNNSAWNWYPVTGYTYNKISSYTYNQINSYTYAGVTGYNYAVASGYTYNKITGYSYNLVSGFTYNQITGYSYIGITGYTYQQISSYTYASGTNYSYSVVGSYSYYGITGYTYSGITGYSYNQITGYSYQSVSSYTYDLITGWTWAKIVSYTYYTYPTTTGLTVTDYDWVLDTGNYKLSSLSGNVLVRGHAVLYVTDSIDTQSITINPGASLKLYTSAPTVSLQGNGVWNADGNAQSFMYYGLPQNQTLKITGNGSLTGVIYAPEADLYLKGGGHDVIDFIGASVSNTATLDGHFNFHYDEALRKSGPTSAFAIQTWNEIPLTQRY